MQRVNFLGVTLYSHGKMKLNFVKTFKNKAKLKTRFKKFNYGLQITRLLPGYAKVSSKTSCVGSGVLSESSR